jgi:hypothetical protein
MRRVTRQTRHTSARGLEAVAGRQHYRLMARVPRVLKICRIPLYAWHAVALTAEIVELSRVELSGISGTYLCGIYYVIRGGSMTRLAPNSQFVGCDYLVRRDLQRAARVTTEAAKYSGLRVKDSVLYSAGVPMSRSKSNAIELAVPGFVLFDIDLRIQPTYKCDGLYTRAERPQSGLGRSRRRQSAGVGAGRLHAKLGGMALGACRRPSVLGCRRPDQKMQWQQDKRSKFQRRRELTQARILTDKTPGNSS